MSLIWIVFIIGIVVVASSVVFAARARRGPDIEGAFVDTELEAEEQAQHLPHGDG